MSAQIQRVCLSPSPSINCAQTLAPLHPSLLPELLSNNSALSQALKERKIVDNKGDFLHYIVFPPFSEKTQQRIWKDLYKTFQVPLGDGTFVTVSQGELLDYLLSCELPAKIDSIDIVGSYPIYVVCHEDPDFLREVFKRLKIEDLYEDSLRDHFLPPHDIDIQFVFDPKAHLGHKELRSIEELLLDFLSKKSGKSKQQLIDHSFQDLAVPDNGFRAFLLFTLKNSPFDFMVLGKMPDRTLFTADDFYIPLLNKKKHEKLNVQSRRQTSTEAIFHTLLGLTKKKGSTHVQHKEWFRLIKACTKGKISAERELEMTLFKETESAYFSKKGFGLKNFIDEMGKHSVGNSLAYFQRALFFLEGKVPQSTFEEIKKAAKPHPNPHLNELYKNAPLELFSAVLEVGALLEMLSLTEKRCVFTNVHEEAEVRFILPVAGATFQLAFRPLEALEALTTLSEKYPAFEKTTRAIFDTLFPWNGRCVENPPKCIDKELLEKMGAKMVTSSSRLIKEIGLKIAASPKHKYLAPFLNDPRWIEVAKRELPETNPEESFSQAWLKHILTVEPSLFFEHWQSLEGGAALVWFKRVLRNHADIATRLFLHAITSKTLKPLERVHFIKTCIDELLSLKSLNPSQLALLLTLADHLANALPPPKGIDRNNLGRTLELLLRQLKPHAPPAFYQKVFSAGGSMLPKTSPLKKEMVLQAFAEEWERLKNGSSDEASQFLLQTFKQNAVPLPLLLPHFVPLLQEKRRYKLFEAFLLILEKAPFPGSETAQCVLDYLQEPVELTYPLEPILAKILAEPLDEVLKGHLLIAAQAKGAKLPCTPVAAKAWYAALEKECSHTMLAAGESIGFAKEPSIQPMLLELEYKAIAHAVAQRDSFGPIAPLVKKWLSKPLPKEFASSFQDLIPSLILDMAIKDASHDSLILPLFMLYQNATLENRRELLCNIIGDFYDKNAAGMLLFLNESKMLVELYHPNDENAPFVYECLFTASIQHVDNTSVDKIYTFFRIVQELSTDRTVYDKIEVALLLGLFRAGLKEQGYLECKQYLGKSHRLEGWEYCKALIPLLAKESRALSLLIEFLEVFVSMNAYDFEIDIAVAALVRSKDFKALETALSLMQWQLHNDLQPSLAACRSALKFLVKDITNTGLELTPKFLAHMAEYGKKFTSESNDVCVDLGILSLKHWLSLHRPADCEMIHKTLNGLYRYLPLYFGTPREKELIKSTARIVCQVGHYPYHDANKFIDNMVEFWNLFLRKGTEGQALSKQEIFTYQLEFAREVVNSVKNMNAWSQMMFASIYPLISYLQTDAPPLGRQKEAQELRLLFLKKSKALGVKFVK